MRFIIFLVGLLGLAMGPGASADIYKWRDASGKVVFSDQPPEDRSIRYEVMKQKRVQSVNRGSPDAARMKKFRERQSRLLDAMQKDREQRRKDQQIAEQAKLKESEKCELVRRQMHGFQTSGRAYKDNPDGTRTWLEAEQRDEFIARYRKFIDEYCL